MSRLKFAVKTTHFIIYSCAPFDYRTKFPQGLKKKIGTPLNFRCTLRIIYKAGWKVGWYGWNIVVMKKKKEKKSKKHVSFNKNSFFHSLYFLYSYFGGKETNPDSCKPAFFGILTLKLI